MKHIIPILTLGILPVAAHDHFAAGITDTNKNGQPDAGEPLRLIGPDLAAKTFHLLPRPYGFRPAQRCGGFYMLDENARTLFPNDAFSLTALSDGQEESGEQDHAHTGAYIWVEITGITGPAGGNFGFWDVGRSAAYDTPTVSFPVGQPTGNHSFVVSGGGNSAGEDPHGHIHGRAWTADKPGDYQVSFRFVDKSTSGPGGGPWHPPSGTFTFHFKAGPDFQPIGKLVAGTGYVLTWPSQQGIWEDFQEGMTFHVLRSTNLATGGWIPIGSVTGTTADTATFTDPSPPAGKAFYRLSYDWDPSGGAEE